MARTGRRPQRAIPRQAEPPRPSWRARGVNFGKWALKSLAGDALWLACVIVATYLFFATGGSREQPGIPTESTAPITKPASPSPSGVVVDTTLGAARVGDRFNGYKDRLAVRADDVVELSALLMVIDPEDFRTPARDVRLRVAIDRGEGDVLQATARTAVANPGTVADGVRSYDTFSDVLLVSETDSPVRVDEIETVKVQENGSDTLGEVDWTTPLTTVPDDLIVPSDTEAAFGRTIQPTGDGSLGVNRRNAIRVAVRVALAPARPWGRWALGGVLLFVGLASGVWRIRARRRRRPPTA